MGNTGDFNMLSAIVSRSLDDSPGSKIRKMQEQAAGKPVDPTTLLESVADRLAHLTASASMSDRVRAELNQIVGHIRGE